MRLRDRSRLSIVAGAVWLLLGAAVAGHRAHAPVPPQAISAIALVALALAAAAAGRSAAHVWRGPPIGRFSKEEAVCCDPGHAAVVRAAAQLRGTLGGAGHVHRGRLGLSALAWLAAAASAAAVLADPSSTSAPLWGAAALVLAGAAARFPAQPFFYREAMGGRVVVHPRVAWDELIVVWPELHREAPLETPAPASGLAGEWDPSVMSAERGEHALAVDPRSLGELGSASSGARRLDS